MPAVILKSHSTIYKVKGNMCSQRETSARSMTYVFITGGLLPPQTRLHLYNSKAVYSNECNVHCKGKATTRKYRVYLEAYS